ncbi:MAG: DNA replication and repair protein RecF [Ignavibacteria bacterium]|nr:DNA replication and repair protein RecF [Ignavibacteria bacterium]
MIIDKIVLRNFRNYEVQELDFNSKFNFICGNNGQGKTNILEGVSFLTYGKSFLGSTESDCVKLGSSRFAVEGVFKNDIGNTELITVSYDLPQRQKSVLRNKEKVSSFSAEIFGRFPVVFLSPASLAVTYGTPSERRKYFDIMLSQASPVYLDCLKELARLLKQKNSLLRSHAHHGKFSAQDFSGMLSSFNEKLAIVSAETVKRRIAFLHEFRKFFEKSFSFLITEDQHAIIEYQSDAFGDCEKEKDDLAGSFLRHFENKAREEAVRGVTLCGPQRDDYLFSMEKGNDRFLLKSFASQGEHKTFLVALKLAEYEYLKSCKSTAPVLLLDDILSELDHSRVAQIVSHLKDYGQIFLTTADHTHIEKMKRFYDEAEISAFTVTEGKAKYEAKSN